jgi:hypothetical protein
MSELDLDRQSQPTGLDRDDGNVAPGRGTLTSRLVPPSRQTLVFRVESAEAANALADRFGPRDANNVSAGADVAVARAASSSGASLPGDVQQKFEASTGADLSGVRVHTGADSAQAASAVGAKAYTTGQDIHFAEGRYAPSDPFGLHLLAHEVAHTVQQSGGAASGRQNKLEVSTPGDSAEVEADRAADAMVAGAPAAIGGSAPTVGRLIQREGEGHAPAAGGAAKGSTTNSLSFEFSNGEFKLKEFELGEFVKAECTFKPTAKVTASKEGGEEHKKEGGAKKEGAAPEGGAAQPAAAPEGGAAQPAANPGAAPANGIAAASPEQKEVEEGVKQKIADLMSKATGKKVEAETGAGLKFDKEKKSVTLGAGFSLSAEVGEAKVEVAPLEISLASWDPKKGFSGPKIGASASITFPTPLKTKVGAWEVSLTVGGSLGIEFTPNYKGLIEKLLIELGVSGAVELAATLAISTAPMICLASALSMAADEAALAGQIATMAKDGKHAALCLATATMGSDMDASTPAQQLALTNGKAAATQAAAKCGMDVYKAGWDGGRSSQLVGQCDRQVRMGYESKVRKAAEDTFSKSFNWRFWKTKEDAVAEAMKVLSTNWP